jgi:hypothetical protein
MFRTLAIALVLAALLAPTALHAEEEGDAAVAKNPPNPNDTKPFPGPVETPKPQPAAQKALDTIKKAANAQGDISPLTVKALQSDPKALEAIGRAPSRPAPANAQRDGGPKSNKAMYGDIIIHK